MANIGKKGLDIQPPVTVKTGETEVKAPPQTGLTPQQKFELLIALIVGVCVVLLVAYVALLANFWQFASNSFNDYSRIVKDYDSKRYNILENRIKDLEIRVATMSAE